MIRGTKKSCFSAFPPILPFKACSVGRIFGFSHTEGCFRPLTWDACKSVPHKTWFSVIYVGRCLHFSHGNGRIRGLMWELSKNGDSQHPKIQNLCSYGARIPKGLPRGTPGHLQVTGPSGKLLLRIAILHVLLQKYCLSMLLRKQ